MMRPTHALLSMLCVLASTPRARAESLSPAVSCVPDPGSFSPEKVSSLGRLARGELMMPGTLHPDLRGDRDIALARLRLSFSALPSLDRSLLDDPCFLRPFSELYRSEFPRLRERVRIELQTTPAPASCVADPTTFPLDKVATIARLLRNELFFRDLPAELRGNREVALSA